MSLPLLLVFVSLATSHDLPSDPVGEQILKLEKEVDDSYSAFAAAYGKAPEAEVERCWQEYMKKSEASCLKILDLVKKAPDSPESFSALAWIVATPRNLALLEGKDAVTLLLEHHSNNPAIGQTCNLVGYYADVEHEPSLDLLRAVLNQNPDRTARGQACLGLARLTWNKGRGLEHQKNGDPPALFREAEKLFDLVIEKYADCPDLRKAGVRRASKTLGEAAENELFEIRRLAVGKTAPEIIGKDVDGKDIKLSDYRGKVVVLTFWASWCGPCMGMVPSERALVKRMKGRPFALLGINGDDDRAKAKETALANEMTWPSFYNGGPNGPITDQWNVQLWPTIYVLDEDGVIRFKQLREKRLDDAVETLVKKLEEDKKQASQ